MATSARREPDFRLSACASPIALDGVDGFQTIPAITPMAFLNPPGTIGTVQVDAPRGGIRPGQYFTARFMSNTGWKRGSFLALAADEAPAMRDVVTIRMLADPQPAPQREHPRQRIGLTLASRIKSATGLDAESPIRVEVIDASAGGVCVETAATLAVGDVLFLEGPDPAATGADFEILRADPALRNRYGGRFLEEQAGRTLYENLVAAAQAERAARRARPAPTAAAPDPTDQSAAPRGMRHRDE